MSDDGRVAALMAMTARRRLCLALPGLVLSLSVVLCSCNSRSDAADFLVTRTKSMQAKRQSRLTKPWYPETPAEKLQGWCETAAGYFLDDRVVHPAIPTTAEDWVCRVLIAHDDCHSAEEMAVIGLKNPNPTTTMAGLRLSESELRRREFHGAALTCLSVSNRLGTLSEQSKTLPALDLLQVQQVISRLREAAVLRSSEFEAAARGNERLFARPWSRAKMESVDQECAAKELAGQALLYALSLRLTRFASERTDEVSGSQRR